MKIYRRIIDGLVVLLAVFVFGPYLLGFLPDDYVDNVTSDDAIALDERLEARFDTAPRNLESLIETPTPLESYTFKKLQNKIALSAADIYEQNTNSVVYINTIGFDGYWYTGSGSIITEDGLVLTNYHVIQDSEQILVATIDGEIYEVESVVAYDTTLDVAFIKLDADNLSPLAIGDFNDVRVGDEVYSIGSAEGFLNTFSDGIISGFRDYSSLGQGIQIQMTNPTSGGSSGGALLNQYGEIVGIPSAALEYDYNAVQVQNINFAVPINSALDLLGT